MTSTRLSPVQFSITGFAAVLVLAWFCYQPALSGAFQLDDNSNLAGLAAIEDAASAANFVMSGTAGPSGRPIALWTFALQAEQWEQGAGAFLRVNILIHLMNAVILAAFFYQLSLLQDNDRHKAIVVATAAASCWVIMPLLASASLLVVQRMTTLSALFVLLGLCGYLLARKRIEAQPRSALIWMSVSLGLGALLATLSKESGCLLPAYILVLEATLLKRPGSIQARYWRVWQFTFLFLPTFLIGAYLLSRAGYPDWALQSRGFSGWDRLLIEAHVLWSYLYKAVLGIPSQLGIYQSSPTISRNIFEPLVLVSSISWVALTAMSLIWRRRYPLVAMAVLWFLVGHIIESSFLPLELYFEHRNYVPIAGPLYALSAFLILGSFRRRKFAAVVVSTYIIASAYSLYVFSSLSGEPSLASRFWAHRYPDSVRAVTTMASYQLAEEGPSRTLKTIDRFVLEQPQSGYLRIQELNLLCMYRPEGNHLAVIDELEAGLPHVEFTHTAGTMLSQLFSTVSRGNCKSVDVGVVESLAERLQRNPRYELVPGYNQFHHRLLAGIARHKGNNSLAIEHLKNAIAIRRSSELNMMMVTALTGAGEHSEAKQFINNAMLDAPMNPMMAVVWRRKLAGLRDYVLALEEQKLRDGAEEPRTNTEADKE